MTRTCAARLTPSHGSEAWLAKIAAAARAMDERRIYDLCSGNGGPLPLLLPTLTERLGGPVELTPTDLFSKQDAVGRGNAQERPGLRYEPAAVDARRLDGNPPGVRTMVGGFHHLRPAEARAVLATATVQRQAICIFEVSQNCWRGVLMALPIPIMVLLLTPLVRPVRVSQWILTYLLPVLPLLIWWDGLISQLRTDSPDELRELTRSIDARTYDWEIGAVRALGVPLEMPYLIGTPRPAPLASPANP